MTSTTSTPDSRIRWPAGHGQEVSRVFAQNIIDITATPEKVWSLLIDCTAWPQWYKHCSDVSITSGGTTLSDGSKFRFKTLGLSFEPLVEIYEPATMLVWTANGPLGTSGAHAWYIEKTATGCRVITEEAQKGALLWLVGGRVQNDLLKNHAEWLRALKELAEEKKSVL